MNRIILCFRGLDGVKAFAKGPALRSSVRKPLIFFLRDHNQVSRAGGC